MIKRLMNWIAPKREAFVGIYTVLAILFAIGMIPLSMLAYFKGEIVSAPNSVLYILGIIVHFVLTSLIEIEPGSLDDDKTMSYVLTILSLFWPASVASLILTSIMRLIGFVFSRAADLHRSFDKITNRIMALQAKINKMIIFNIELKKEIIREVEEDLPAQGIYRDAAETCKSCGKFK